MKQLNNYPEYKQFLIEVCRIYGYEKFMANVLVQDEFWYHCFDERMTAQEAVDQFNEMCERELEQIGFRFESSATPSGNDYGKNS